MGRSKGGSGAKNGRDSNPKHLGVKVYGGLSNICTIKVLR